MLLKRITLLFSVLLLAFGMRAQDSTAHLLPPDSMQVWYFYNHLDSADQEKYYYIDTVLAGVQEVNPIRQGKRFYADLGNIGQAQTNLLYTPRQSISFNYGPNNFSTFWMNFEDIRYFNEQSPYTNVQYVTGPGRMQILGLTHSQNLFKALYVGVDFKLINSFGDYPQQKTDDYNLAVNMRYFTKDKRYGATFAWINNRVTNRENGGIKYDSLFTQNLETNRAAYAVNLSSAETRLKRGGIEVFQFFNIVPPGGRKKKEPKVKSQPVPPELLADTNQTDQIPFLTDSLSNVPDSLMADSFPFLDSLPIVLQDTTTPIPDSIIITEEMLRKPPMLINPLPFSSLSEPTLVEKQNYFSSADSIIRADSINQIQKKIFNPGRISWRFRLYRDIYMYADESGETGFYENYYHGENTFDSVSVVQMHNIFAWSNTNPEAVDQKNLFRLYLYLQHQHIRIGGDVGKYEFDQIIPRGELATRILGRFELRGEASVVSGGYNDGDYMLRASIQTKLGNKNNPFVFTGEASIISQSAPWDYFYHNANNFMWLNDFNKTTSSWIGASIGRGETYLSMRYYVLNELLYFNEKALPAQLDGNTGLLQASLFSKNKLGNWHFDNQLIFQQLSNNEALRLPKFMAKSRVYFRFPMFKRALMLQPGFSLFYTTAYQAKAYMPSSRIFYLQNNGEYGNYPYIDFFVNFRVQRARLFLKYVHITKGLFGYEYMAVPGYPMKDGGIMFGLQWRFHD